MQKTRPEFPLQEIQNALTAEGMDGWLLYDFRGSNVVARSILQLSDLYRHAPLVLFHSS